MAHILRQFIHPLKQIKPLFKSERMLACILEFNGFEDVRVLHHVLDIQIADVLCILFYKLTARLNLVAH